MADTSNLSNYLKDVADAIRVKKESTEQIPAANFDTEILGIKTGIDLPEGLIGIYDSISDLPSATDYAGQRAIVYPTQDKPYPTLPIASHTLVWQQVETSNYYCMTCEQADVYIQYGDTDDRSSSYFWDKPNYGNRLNCNIYQVEDNAWTIVPSRSSYSAPRTLFVGSNTYLEGDIVWYALDGWSVPSGTQISNVKVPDFYTYYKAYLAKDGQWRLDLINTSDATAQANDIISPKTAYVNEDKVTGTIIAEYASEGTNSKMTLVSNGSSQRVIGFSKNNLFSIELDYINKQFIIRNENFAELKTVPIIDVISTFNGTVNYDGRMYMSISNNNVHDNPNCYYVYITLGIFRDYVSVFNFETLTFNYEIEGYAGFYDVLSRKIHEEGVIISQVYFSELEDNVAFGYSYDGNNYNRFYKLVFNNDGTVTKINLGPGANLGHKDYAFCITSSVDGSVLQLLLASDKDYDNTSTTMIKRLVYISSTFEATYVATPINYVFSPSGQLAVDSTGVYHNIFDISAKKFTIGEKILDFSSSMNILYFINENTVACFGDNNKQLKIIIFNVDEKTYVVNTYNLNYPFTHKSVLTANRLNAINQQYNRLDVTADDILYKIVKDGATLYNPYNTTASTTDIMQGTTAYTKDGKITGTMPNNGELNYEVSTAEQIIPEGYTSGGIIAASPITNEEYDECLELTQQILGEDISL